MVYACKNAAESVQYSPWFIYPASIFLADKDGPLGEGMMVTHLSHLLNVGKAGFGALPILCQLCL